MTRRSKRNIRENVIKRIEKYGLIQNVAGDGNCTFYAYIVGLEHQGIPVNSNIQELQKSLYDHIQNTKKDIFNTVTFTGKKRKRTKQDFINQDALLRLWKKVQVINRAVVEISGYMLIQCFQSWLTSSDVTLYGLI